MGIPVPISGHNEPLPPDELTTIQFNYEWRRLVTELLWPLTFDGFWTGTDADVTDAVSKARAMIEDIYTEETVQFGCRISTSVNQPHIGAPVTSTVVDWEAPGTLPLTYDVGGFFDIAIPGLLTVPAGGAGLYRLIALLDTNAGAFGARTASIVVNVSGANVNAARNSEDVSGRWAMPIVGDAELAVGDTIKLQIQSPNNLTLLAGTGGQPFLSVHRIAPLP